MHFCTGNSVDVGPQDGASKLPLQVPVVLFPGKSRPHPEQ